MHCFIIRAHPEQKSLNDQLALTAKETFEAQGHTAEISDLYRMEFDPREQLCHYPMRAGVAPHRRGNRRKHRGSRGGKPDKRAQDFADPRAACVQRARLISPAPHC
jgi:NAD(P)H dehydrogenase (quinone)